MSGASGASRLASPTAFELAAGPRGATLVFAPRGAGRPALASVALDVSGNRRGSVSPVLDRAVTSGEVTDVSAAFVDERLAAAWIERAHDATRLRAAWVEPKARVFELGDAWRGPPTARGNVVVAARNGAGLVFARGGEVGCIEPGKHACYSFFFNELGRDGARRTGLPLSV
ncbi:MAG TPA: hypothetical protein VMS65_08955, partial [Polyangiaceae bacterium]|nr:hypothetical protein [Polyangiaceae bacterium]